MAETRMSIEEFRREGFLQEANRRFFHPLGLALVVTRGSSDVEAVKVAMSAGMLPALNWLIDEAVKAGVTDDDYVDGIRRALADNVEPLDDIAWISGVQRTDDPEGIVFGKAEERVSSDGVVLTGAEERRRKQENVDRLWAEHAKARMVGLGYMVQDLS